MYPLFVNVRGNSNNTCAIENKLGEATSALEIEGLTDAPAGYNAT
jgi:hypothetical protein